MLSLSLKDTLASNTLANTKNNMHLNLYTVMLTVGVTYVLMETSTDPSKCSQARSPPSPLHILQLLLLLSHYESIPSQFLDAHLALDRCQQMLLLLIDELAHLRRHLLRR